MCNVRPKHKISVADLTERLQMSTMNESLQRFSYLKITGGSRRSDECLRLEVGVNLVRGQPRKTKVK